MKPDVDRLDKMTREVRALTETYLDGAGIFAYRENKAKSGYEIVSIPWVDRIVDLDDLVHRIANQINDLAASGVAAEDDVPKPRLDVTALELDSADPVD